MKKEIYDIEGLTCGNCAAKIERHLNKDEFISEAALDFSTGRLYVTYKNEPYSLEQTINKIMEASDDDLTIKYASKTKDGPRKLINKRIVDLLIRLGVGIVLLFIGLFAIPDHLFWLEIVFYSLSLVVLIYDITWKTISRVIKLKNPIDENLLLTISSVGAFLMGLPIFVGEGAYLEGIMIIAFYQIGQIFEEIAINKSRNEIMKAVDLQADVANLIVDDEIKTIHPSELKLHDLILIKVGEIIPVDGVIVNGHGSIDTSSLTGEFMPVDVDENDHVLSGSILQSGSLTIKVERLFEDSAISKILELVTNSGERKSKAEKFITKFARFYTPIVLVVALIVAFVPLVFTSQTYDVWVYNALSIIVVSCPCAIVISIPLAYFAGIGLASKNGILVKGSNYLDELVNLGYILTDKTGTLTYGYFEVKKAVPFEMEEDLFWEYLVAVESQSNHPIAKAIIHDRKNTNAKVVQENYHEVPGAGVSSTYQGINLVAGKPSFLKTAGVEVPEVDEKGTIIYLSVDQKYAGYVVLNDTAKYDSKHMVKQLKKMKIDTILLSGDHVSNVEDIAKEVGIEKYFGQLTPAEKLEILEDYLKNADGKGVGFVGDGVNDAPSIIRSDVGFAMSGIGSDLAVENAEVIIVNDNPIKVVDAIKIAKKTRWIAIFNIVFSLFVKFSIVILVLLNLLGDYQMTIAMIADTGLTVVMILNSLLILYYKV